MALLKTFIQDYLTDTTKRCRASTAGHYKKRLSSFLRDLGHLDQSEITAQVIKDHLEQESKWRSGDQIGQLKAPDTIRSTVVAWEQLQKWLIENDRISVPITPKKLAKPGGRKRELIPTKEETKALLEKATADFKQIYLALRLTGARPGELCAAHIAQLDRKAGEIVLTQHKTAAKTGKPRRIAVGHASLITILEAAIGTRTEGFIFLRANGRPWKPEMISAAYRVARKAAGLRNGLVPYLARHEHATAIYKTTGDIKAVADLLGHAQISTTMRYTRVDIDQMKNNQQRFDDSLD